MEWIEAYFEDPIFQVQAKPKAFHPTIFAYKNQLIKFSKLDSYQAEALLWLELNWCDDEKPMCIPALQVHLPSSNMCILNSV